jgi:SPP1 family holin
MEYKISTATVVRTVCLVLALVNQLLSALGKSPLPIDDTTMEQLVTCLITTAAALVNWWENNSFTQEAIKADDLYNTLRKNKA